MGERWLWILYLYYVDFISVLKILYYNEISDLISFAERTKFIDIPRWKYGRHEMHLRFRFNCGVYYHDLAERGTNPLTRREELYILRERKTPCIDASKHYSQCNGRFDSYQRTESLGFTHYDRSIWVSSWINDDELYVSKGRRTLRYYVPDCV